MSLPVVALDNLIDIDSNEDPDFRDILQMGTDGKISRGP